jgi:hypothetical protein
MHEVYHEVTNNPFHRHQCTETKARRDDHVRNSECTTSFPDPTTRIQASNIKYSVHAYSQNDTQMHTL